MTVKAHSIDSAKLRRQAEEQIKKKNVTAQFPEQMKIY